MKIVGVGSGGSAVVDRADVRLLIDSDAAEPDSSASLLPAPLGIVEPLLEGADLVFVECSADDQNAVESAAITCPDTAS